MPTVQGNEDNRYDYGKGKVIRVVITLVFYSAVIVLAAMLLRGGC